MKLPASSARSRGFTLIELLVVIVIIGVLAGILLPVFASIQEKGRETKCSSNLKQLGAAFLLFAGEHNQQLPGTYDTRDKDQTNPDLAYQGSWLSGKNGNADETTNVPMTGTIYPYVNDVRVYRCPSQHKSPALGDGLGSNGLFDYAYFCRLGGARLSNVPLRGRLRGASISMPMIIEENPMSYINSKTAGNIEGTHGFQDQASTVHRNGCNYVSVDGSVHRIETPDKTSPILAQEWEANLDGINYLNIGMPNLDHYGQWADQGVIKQ